MRLKAAAGVADAAIDAAWARDLPCPDGPAGFRWIALRIDSLSAGARAREVWERHKPTVMQEWLQAYPGTRPMLWWIYDAPHPWIDAEPEYAHLRNPGYARHQRMSASESQKRTYLVRHKQLTPSEKRRLPQAAVAAERPALRVIEPKEDHHD